ncbi:hypothetical protein ADM96_37300 [Burkholderia sp. ST111]|nr:hypothetical protein ADM96_37300 [Burkholderia sp. ST111]
MKAERRSSINRLSWQVYLFALATVLAVCPVTCFAVGYYVSEFHEIIKVDSSGRIATHVAMDIALSSDAAVQHFSQYSVPYNAELQKLEIDEAETIHADGTHVTVDRQASIFDRPEAVTVSAPQFSGMHMRVVAFPAISKGDTIHLVYTVSDTETLFPGKFSVAQPFPPSVDYRSVSVAIDTPSDMTISLATPGLTLQKDGVSSGRRMRIYGYHNPDGGPRPEQANVLGWSDVAPYFAASNFRDYRDLARQYDVRARSMAKVSPDIQQLADQLTNGVTDRREQARRLYEWVSRNIRYVGVYLGAGGVVPHAAEDVLRNRYGDCKDHVTVFEALLSAKHIASDQVLINVGNQYRLPAAPVIVAFNHAITWLPEFNLFADTTAGFAPFGALTFAESDKPALDAASGALLRTPPQNSSNSRSLVTYALSIDSNGDAKVRGQVELTGDIGIPVRQYFSQRSMDRIAFEMLDGNGLTGSLQVKPDSASVLSEPFVYSLRGKLDQIAVMPGPAAIAIPQLPTFSRLQTFVDMVLQQKGRSLDGACQGTRVDERYTVTIPPQADVLATPTGVDAQSGEISYHSTYRREGNTIVVERILDRNLTSNVCSGAQLTAWVNVARVISKDLRRQVLYK